ncbi:MAG: TMEM175 family protein [Candidatus Eremiobacteraeota bacterium]|nr:TMEM175 family protein [Candidatus Eremiobacteraeota bacterium]
MEREEFTLSKPRFEALSDGVFAIAITLLILEIHLPDHRFASATGTQVKDLLSLGTQYFVYFATFATIGIMWLNHHALFRYVERITHGMAIANLLLLSLICFLPFATEVIARFGLSPVTIVYYGLVGSLISVGYLVLQRQVIAAHASVPRKLTLWNLVGLAFYPIATVIGYFFPLGGLFVFGLLALFYMLPQNVRSAAVRP